jgi:plastocyanin
MAGRGVALLLAGAVLVVGCSPAARHTPEVIRIDSRSGFQPASASVRVGGSIVWSNEDNVVHRVQIADQQPFDVLPGDVVVTRLETKGQLMVRDLDRGETYAVLTVSGSS